MRYWEKLEKMGACKDAVEWCKKFSSLQKAWDACDRGDRMMWLIARCNPTEAQYKAIVLAACDCADLVEEYRRPEDKKVLAYCLETVHKWTRGEATIQEVRDAYAAAYAASTATYAAYAASAAAYAASDAASTATYAAYAASTAAYAASDAASTATYAAYAASTAAYAASDATYAANAAAYAASTAGVTTSKQCADIIRKYLSCPRL